MERDIGREIEREIEMKMEMQIEKEEKRERERERKEVGRERKMRRDRETRWKRKKIKGRDTALEDLILPKSLGDSRIGLLRLWKYIREILIEF